MRTSKPNSMSRAYALISIVLAGSVALACADDQPAPTPDASTVRELTGGRVVGTTTGDGAHVWRGIPFAATPVGDLRWRAPRPPLPWTGERQALAFADGCMQIAGPGGGADGSHFSLVTNSYEIVCDIFTLCSLLWKNSKNLDTIDVKNYAGKKR